MAITLRVQGIASYAVRFRYKKHPDPDSLRALNCFISEWSVLGIPCPSIYFGRVGPQPFLQAAMVTYRQQGKLYACKLFESTEATEQQKQVWGMSELDPTDIVLDDNQVPVSMTFNNWYFRGDEWGFRKWGFSDELFHRYPDQAFLMLGPTGVMACEGYPQCKLDRRYWSRVNIPNDGPPGVPWPPAIPEFWDDAISFGSQT